MKTKAHIVFFLLSVWAINANAQTVPLLDSLASASDSTKLTIDSLQTMSDSTIVLRDSLSLFNSTKSASNDSLRPRPGNRQSAIDWSKVKLSSDGLDEQIDYTATDSMHYDVESEMLFLYGNATIKYTTMTITAHQISLNWGKNEVEAIAKIDERGKVTGAPEFNDGDQNMTAHKIKYNFKTKKGIIYDLSTQQGNDMNLLSAKAKLISPADSTQDDVIYSSNAIFTTCNHSVPHFGIRSRKQKIIPNKIVVTGLSNLEVAGIPSPVWLPFGVFPLKQGERTGLIFPQNYEFSPVWGYGFENIGWFFPINDYMNLRLTGNIYTRGTWGINADVQYLKRYKHDGTLNVSFSNRRNQNSIGLPIINRSWNFRWSHRQAATAHPYNTFSVSANIQTNNFLSLNGNSAEDRLTNTLNSNITFNRKFPGTPFNFSSSASHTQNTNTRVMDLRLPVMALTMNQVYPFKNKNRGGNEEKWYEKISLDYKLDAQNRFIATDTTLFSKQTLEDAQYGARHTMNTNASFRVLKHFNLSPSIRYRENWYFNSLNREFIDTFTVLVDTIYNIDSTDSTEARDTIAYGTVNDIMERGFEAVRLYDMSLTLNTQIFGTREFTKGFIRGVRHVIKPSVSFNYTPDYTDPDRGYYDRVQTDLRPGLDEPELYSRFRNAIYDRPGSRGKVMGLSYSLNNIFEAKYFSRKDSSINKLKLFDNIYVGGSYNFVADSLKADAITARGTTRFFKGITTFSFSAVFDPYAAVLNDRGTRNQRINTLYWDTNKRLLRFDRAEFRLNSNLSVSQIRDMIFGKGKGSSGRNSGASTGGRQSGIRQPGVRTDRSSSSNDDLLSTLSSFRLSHTFSLQLNRIDGRDTTFVQAHSLRLSGRIPLTDKWNITVGNLSYDFKSDRLVFPDLSFSRDLHCWEMGLSWRPEIGTYSFFIRVKPGTLDFIKIPYGTGNQDAIGF